MKEKGFTLVELLVVVAIIGVLISLSMPALGRARVVTKRTKCMAHLRAIGQGVQAYLDVNRERYPWASSFPLPQPAVPPGPIAMGAEDDGEQEDPIPDADLPPIYLAIGNEIGHQQKVFICPADRNTKETRISTSTYHRALGTSYEWDALAYNGRRVGHTRYTGRKGAGEESGLGLSAYDAPMIFDYEAFHGGEQKRGSLVTLFADLHISADAWVDAVVASKAEQE
jgi:prepilin-type N-terminal cleavage/methylation domain-containing protein